MAFLRTSRTMRLARPVPTWPWVVDEEQAARHKLLFVTMPTSHGCWNAWRRDWGAATITGTPDFQRGKIGGYVWNFSGSTEYFSLSANFASPPYSMWCWAAFDSVYSNVGLMELYLGSGNWWTIYLPSTGNRNTEAMYRHDKNPYEWYSTVSGPAFSSGEYHLFGSSVRPIASPLISFNAWFDDLVSTDEPTTQSRGWVTMTSIHLGVKLGDPEYFGGQMAFAAVTAKDYNDKQRQEIYDPRTRFQLIREVPRRSYHFLGTAAVGGDEGKFAQRMTRGIARGLHRGVA